MEYINTVLTHAQMLPYFRQHVVTPELLEEVKHINEARTKQPEWKWQHLRLPKTHKRASRFFTTRVVSPEYKYTEGQTKMLEHEDARQLIALTFCKVYLTRFLQLTFKARRT